MKVKQQFLIKKNKIKSELLEEMKQSETYKKIIEIFPDAELIDVKEEEK